MPWKDAPTPSLVVQSARLYLASVFENVAQGLHRSRLTVAEQREHVVALLEEFGLGELRDALSRRAVDLSLGQQRRLALVRAMSGSPRFLMVDEPTAGLEGADRSELLDLLTMIRAKSAVLFVTHNRQDALALGADTVFLESGSIVDRVNGSNLAQRWASAPPLSVGVHDLVHDAIFDAPTPPPLPAGYTPSPQGFHWIFPGSLGGAARPGLLRETQDDLADLQALNVKYLVCLEETRPISEKELAPYGLSALHVPIVDMEAPSVETILSLCIQLDAMISSHHPVVVHCRAGLGRTGTVLAAYLVHRGASALDALEQVRRVQRRFVQSDAQVRFLEDFHAHVAGTLSH
jgi:atypical dual specificity phosphatase